MTVVCEGLTVFAPCLVTWCLTWSRFSMWLSRALTFKSDCALAFLKRLHIFKLRASYRSWTRTLKWVYLNSKYVSSVYNWVVSLFLSSLKFCWFVWSSHALFVTWISDFGNTRLCTDGEQPYPMYSCLGVKTIRLLSKRIHVDCQFTHTHTHTPKRRPN